MGCKLLRLSEETTQEYVCLSCYKIEVALDGFGRSHELMNISSVRLASITILEECERSMPTTPFNYILDVNFQVAASENRKRLLTFLLRMSKSAYSSRRLIASRIDPTLPEGHLK